MNDLFSEIRNAVPAVEFDETRAHVEAYRPDRKSPLEPAGRKGGQRRGELLLKGGIAVGLAGLILWGALRTGDSGPVQAGLEREAETVVALSPFQNQGVEQTEEKVRVGENLLVGIAEGTNPKKGVKKREGAEEENERKTGEAEETEASGLYSGPAPFVRGVRMLSLSDEDLGRLGIIRDTAGVWAFNRDDKGNVSGFQISMYGTVFMPTAALPVSSPPDAPAFRPVVITDDLGNRRVEVFEDKAEQEMRGDDPYGYLSRWRILDKNIKKKLSLYFSSVGLPQVTENDTFIVAGATDPVRGEEHLYQIRVPSVPGAAITTRRDIAVALGSVLYDRILERDYIHEEIEPERYDGSMQIAAGYLIPILVRTGREYTAADKGAHHWRPDCIFWYRVTPEFLAALPEEIGGEISKDLDYLRRLERKPKEESIETYVEREMPEFRERLEVSGEYTEDPSQTTAVAGELLSDFWRSASGAVTSSMLLPNPVRQSGECFVRYHLSASRSVSLDLYDVNGKHVRTFARPRERAAGEYLEALDVKDMSAGVYLLVISTERNERGVQRMIVE